MHGQQNIKKKNTRFGRKWPSSGFLHSNHLRLFYTIREAACLMRRSQHQNPLLEDGDGTLQS